VLPLVTLGLLRVLRRWNAPLGAATVTSRN
jgi:hypothetical protein